MSLDKIIVTPLNRINVAGGDVLHVLKKIDQGFVDFGEAYFSLIEFGAIKSWKRHLKMTLNLIVPVGMVKFVFFDGKNERREEIIGTDRYVRLTVPPGIWFAFQGISDPYSLVLNIADIAHEAEEIERKNLDEYINYWEQQ